MLLIWYVLLPQLANVDLCVHLTLLRQNVVNNVQPAAVKAYAYYDPGKQNIHVPGNERTTSL